MDQSTSCFLQDELLRRCVRVVQIERCLQYCFISAIIGPRNKRLCDILAAISALYYYGYGAMYIAWQQHGARGQFFCCGSCTLLHVTQSVQPSSKGGQALTSKIAWIGTNLVVHVTAVHTVQYIVVYERPTACEVYCIYAMFHLGAAGGS